MFSVFMKSLDNLSYVMDRKRESGMAVYHVCNYKKHSFI